MLELTDLSVYISLEFGALILLCCSHGQKYVLLKQDVFPAKYM